MLDWVLKQIQGKHFRWKIQPWVSLVAWENRVFEKSCSTDLPLKSSPLGKSYTKCSERGRDLNWVKYSRFHSQFVPASIQDVFTNDKCTVPRILIEFSNCQRKRKLVWELNRKVREIRVRLQRLAEWSHSKGNRHSTVSIGRESSTHSLPLINSRLSIATGTMAKRHFCFLPAWTNAAI